MAERIEWHSPVAAIAGKEAAKVKKAIGVSKVGGQLSTYPRE